MSEKFARYVCPNDSVTFTLEGFTVTVTVEYDQDTKPSDSECYSAEDVARWKNDEWFYCGLVASVAKNGIQVVDHAASLWGIDCNFGADNAYLDEVATDLADEAIEAARKILPEIIAKLSA